MERICSLREGQLNLIMEYNTHILGAILFYFQAVQIKYIFSAFM